MTESKQSLAEQKPDSLAQRIGAHMLAALDDREMATFYQLLQAGELKRLFEVLIELARQLEAGQSGNGHDNPEPGMNDLMRHCAEQTETHH